MDRYEGIATLEWWANPSTCPGRFDVCLTVSAASAGWRAEAVAVNPWTAENREGFGFLMELDPVFTLRFTDESAVLVQVTETQDGERFTLSTTLDI
jgi:hypothetical protein